MRLKKQYDRHRSNVFVYKTITASSPFIEVDLKLSPQQMLMFIHGLKYVTPCQSRFSRQSIDDRVTEQYEVYRLQFKVVFVIIKCRLQMIELNKHSLL